MKKLLYFFTGCVIVGLIISTIFAMLPVFPYIGKAYLTAIEKKQYNQAYIIMSTEFKKKNDFQHFISMAQQSPMAEYKDVNWLKTVHDKKLKTSYIVGAMTMKNNNKILIQINFVQEKGVNWQDQGWRINDLHFEGAGKG